MRRVQRGKIIGVTFRHDRVDPAISQVSEVRICAERILPEVGENESTDDWTRRQRGPPQFPDQDAPLADFWMITTTKSHCWKRWLERRLLAHLDRSANGRFCRSSPEGRADWEWQLVVEGGSVANRRVSVSEGLNIIFPGDRVGPASRTLPNVLMRLRTGRRGMNGGREIRCSSRTTIDYVFSALKTESGASLRAQLELA